MRAVSPARFLALGLLALGLAAGGCDHKERSTANPAAEAWTVADGAMTKRMSQLRDRQKVLAGRAAVLAVPEGTEDATLASVITDVQGQLAAIDAACNAAEGALNQARTDATAAQAYITGQADLIATNSLIIPDLAKRAPNKEFDLKFLIRRSPAHMGVRQGEFALVRWLDGFIFFNTMNGELDKLHQKWLGAKMIPMPTL